MFTAAGNTMGVGDWLLLIFIIICAVIAGVYFLNRWAYKKMDEQNQIIEQNKMSATIYVISKKRDKITNIKLPKAVADQIPARAKLVKMNFIQAKVGPQIMTLIAEKNIYEAIPLKRNVKVELAGIYIVGMQGLKSADKLKEEKKIKKQKEKEAAAAEKKNKKKK
jgi:hypothetical protein